MLNIPHKALNIGAENKSQSPVKYNKTRLSGSNKTTYNLHIKGASMPGCKEKFTATSITKPGLSSDMYNNKIMQAFKLKNNGFYNYQTSNYKRKDIKPLEYNEFVPNDDDTLLIAINALYRHIFGNMYIMDSQRPFNIERRLRNGDITIKEFTRQLCQSSIYQYHYFDKMSQYKSIKLRYKHILGRPVMSQQEINESSVLLDTLGFKKHIDWLVDSEEYKINFGDDIVPYMRSWNSQVGLKTKSFLDTSLLTKAFATSDICSFI